MKIQLIQFAALVIALKSGAALAAPAGSVTVDPLQSFTEVTSVGVINCAFINGAEFRAGTNVNTDGSLFKTYATQVTQTKKKLKDASGSQYTKLKKKLASLKQKKNVGDPACADGPPPEDPPALDNFDAFGNVTETGKVNFGIPSHLSANVSQGLINHNQSCAGCHSAYVNRTFDQYRFETSQAPMYFTPVTLPDEFLGHLTAYYNRFQLP